MSMSFREFSCSRCAFRDDDTVAWGLMNYQTPAGLIPVQRQLGWCGACGGLAPIEVLPSRERLTREREMQDEQARMEALAGRTSGPRCLICGSVEVIALPEGIQPAGTWFAPEAPVAVGMGHPGCDGALMVRHSDIRVRMFIPEREYTVEGVLVAGAEVAEEEPGARQGRLFD